MKSLPTGLMKIGFFRRSYYLIQYLLPCTRITFFTPGEGIYTKDGRALVRGKFRRMFFSAFPSLAVSMQKKYGLQGGCTSCGASCKLLFQCPHWDEETHLCKIYEDRPPACRFFPITPGDIRDRNIVLKDEPCGFVFTKPQASQKLKDLKNGIKPVLSVITPSKTPKK